MSSFSAPDLPGTFSWQSSVLSLLLNPQFIREAAAAILDLWRTSRFRGTYTVDGYDATLELLDNRGYKSIYTKEQHITYIQDKIFAIQDQAWGDGNIFAAYKCSPGVAVDRYKEGYRYKILISLRATKNKGDSDNFHVERVTTNGYTRQVNNFQTQIDHPTKGLQLHLIFPASRYPKRVSLIEQNANRSRILNQDNMQELPGRRIKYSWSEDKPHLFESYILQWEW